MGDFVVARRTVEHDQLLTRDLGHRDRLPFREGVVRRAYQDEVLRVKRAQLEVRVADRSPEPDLHLVTKHELDHVFGVAGPHRNLDAGVRGDELLEHLGQHVRADGGCGGDHQVAGGRGHHLLERVPAVDQRPQRALGERDPRAAGVGQAHAVRRAQEQRRAELALQAVEARGQRRLGDEKRLGGAADAAPTGDLEEALDLHELDAARLSVTCFFYGHGRTLQILSIASPSGAFGATSP